MKKALFITLFFFLMALTFGAQDYGVAKVIILKGTVHEVKVSGEKVLLSRGAWVTQGSIVKSESRSFVKLLFIDKSQMNLGPESEMKIKEFPRNKAGIINLLKGKVRAQVTKNYMDMDRKKSKLFIKTKTAAMGVRGTDFQVIYNPRNDVTSLITFEGAVAMAKVDSAIGENNINQNLLETTLNRRDAVVVKEGQYSGSAPNQRRVSIPVKISPTQLESLKTQQSPLSSSDTRKPASGGGKSQKVVRSIVPEGLNPKKFAEANQGVVEKVIEGSVGKQGANEMVVGSQEAINQVKSGGPPPEGFVDKSTGAYAPAAGGFVDEKTGLYVPPPDGSSFDPNAGVYLPPPEVGSVDTDSGAYVPPEGFKLVDSGELVPIEGREIASIDSETSGDSLSTEGGSGAVTNVLEPNVIDDTESTEGSIDLFQNNETEDLAQDFQQESTIDFNNQDPNLRINSGRSNVDFRISR